MCWLIRNLPPPQPNNGSLACLFSNCTYLLQTEGEALIQLDVYVRCIKTKKNGYTFFFLIWATEECNRSGKVSIKVCTVGCWKLYFAIIAFTVTFTLHHPGLGHPHAAENQVSLFWMPFLHAKVCNNLAHATMCKRANKERTIKCKAVTWQQWHLKHS